MNLPPLRKAKDSDSWPEPFRSRASEAFKNANYYDAIETEQLHHTDPIEALDEAVDRRTMATYQKRSANTLRSPSQHTAANR